MSAAFASGATEATTNKSMTTNSSKTKGKRPADPDTGSRKKGPASQKKSAAGSDELFNPTQRLDANGQLIRHNKLGKDRIKMDQGRCIALGTADPQACHIIPFSSCKSKPNLADFAFCLRSAICFLLEDDFDDDVFRMFTSHVGSSNELWNLISLNPQLHAWWGKAYFGFKCLGIFEGDKKGEAKVRIQFVWMPRPTMIWKQDTRDEDELRHHLTNDQSPMAGVAAFRLSGRPLATGDTFDVVVSKADQKKMKMAFDLQWSLIRIAALTGAADVEDITIQDDDDNAPTPGVVSTGDVFAQKMVWDWLENVEAGPPEDPESQEPHGRKPLVDLVVTAPTAPSSEVKATTSQPVTSGNVVLKENQKM